MAFQLPQCTLVFLKNGGLGVKISAICKGFACRFVISGDKKPPHDSSDIHLRIPLTPNHQHHVSLGQPCLMISVYQVVKLGG